MNRSRATLPMVGSSLLVVVALISCADLFALAQYFLPWVFETSDAPVASEGMTELEMTRVALEYEIEQVQKTETAAAAAPPPPAPQIEAPPGAPVLEPPAAAAPAASPATGGSPPVITRVDFPSGIPANGTRFTGWVSFIDPDGDVNWMTLEVVSSKTMKGSAGDPREHMQGSPTNGRCWMQFWCYVKQDITMRVTLHDAAGNHSNAVDFQFECQ